MQEFRFQCFLQTGREVISTQTVPVKFQVQFTIKQHLILSYRGPEIKSYPREASVRLCKLETLSSKKLKNQAYNPTISATTE